MYFIPLTTATTATGYHFVSWSCTGTGCYSGTSPSTTITLGVDNMQETAAGFADSVKVYVFIAKFAVSCILSTPSVIVVEGLVPL